MNKTGDSMGFHDKIGKLFRFDLAMRTFRDGGNKQYNKFFTVGSNGILYAHNQGYLPETPENAANYFIKALEHLPNLIERSQKMIDRLKNDIPILEKILEDKWNNADKLQEIKTELADLERKIRLSLESIN